MLRRPLTPYASMTPTSTSPFFASSLTVFCSDFSSFSSAGLLIRFFATCAILLTEPWRCIGGGGAVVVLPEWCAALSSVWEDGCNALETCGWVEVWLWLWSWLGGEAVGSAGSVGEAGQWVMG